MPTFKNAAATLAVRDVGAAKPFYEETLGLKAQEESPSGIAYEVGSSIVFVYPSEFAGTNQGTAVNIEVDDVEATVAELRERGVTFEEYDFPGMKTVDGIMEFPEGKGAFFKDPDGNILSLLQRNT
jgi:predicted enzyme related to lactoylglutathione lyase